MQRRAILCVFVGLMALWLAGCHHDEDIPPAAPGQPIPGNGPTAGNVPNKAGAAPTTAPALGVNPDYNAPATGSKGK